ncbi:MAG: hypothetical protein KKF62_02525 [Bacteroidetes bacterium]|nr:hypothetical protein [Bacteroidota bacterium]MBU1800370.1 hypothetical protein [Bacteroidota bacterium]
MGKLSLFSVIILILISSISYSQINEENDSPNEIRSLTGIHSIYMNLGFKMNSSTSANATVSEVKAESNFIGFIGYQYWLDMQWSVNATMGVFSAEANVNYTNVSSISIIPLLFGISYYPEALSLGRVGRVHFGVNTGIYMGSGSKSSVNFNNLSNIGASSVNETVFGVEPNVGIDFFLSKWIKIGSAVSYHFLSEFKEVVGNRKNYSGPVFSINIGILL